MSTEERKAREKEQRSNDIIDAAETVIFSKGLEQATMEEIAEEAELSKGTLYLYFKNKNELYMAICERGSNLLNGRISEIFTDDHTGLELIRLMGETYLDFVQTHPDYFNAFQYYDTLQNTEELKNSDMAQTCEYNMRQSMKLMIRALQIGMEDGTIDDSYDPRELAILIWASTHGITRITHMRKTGHHFKMLDQMEVSVSSLFKNFLNLIGVGMATEKGRKQKTNNNQVSVTQSDA